MSPSLQYYSRERTFVWFLNHLVTLEIPGNKGVTISLNLSSMRLSIPNLLPFETPDSLRFFGFVYLWMRFHDS